MEGHPLRYFALTICNVMVTLTSNIYFIYILQMGIIGALYAALLGSTITFVISFPYIIKRINIKYFSYSTLKELLIFGLPFLPSIIYQMVIDFSDRIILLNLTNMDLVGVYSAGYKIGGLLLLLISGFRLGWEPYFLKLENDLDYSENEYHGSEGYIKVNRFPKKSWDPVHDAFYQSCIDYGFDDCPDHNKPDSMYLYYWSH